MKRLLITVTAVPVLALVAAAQDPIERKMKAELENVLTQSKFISISGGMMSSPVKGAPYSAVEVNETNHVLADGTRIHNENKTTVYRDSEGRVRRETPNQTTIMDPVAGVTYFLNPKTMTATKANLSIPAVFTKRVSGGGVGGAMTGGEVATFEVRKDGLSSVTIDGKSVDLSVMKADTLPRMAMPVDGAMLDAMKVSATAGTMVAGAPSGNFVFGEAGATAVPLRRTSATAGKTEALGKQMMEGVNSDGSRFTSTLETGAVGNDRPIQIINERWFSSELQTVMMTKHSDPRSGDEVFRLTNVSRGEPGSDLFQVPPSYQLIERK